MARAFDGTEMPSDAGGVFSNKVLRIVRILNSQLYKITITDYSSRIQLGCALECESWCVLSLPMIT